jgi:hypothetical protein
MIQTQIRFLLILAVAVQATFFQNRGNVAFKVDILRP